MISSTPLIKEQPPSRLQRLNIFLDKHVLPYPVRFLTNRVIILATLALLIPLIFFTNQQAFVNALNSYLNVMSVVVGSTVLLYATLADVRDRAAAKRAEEMAKAYEQVLEERVQEREEIAKAYEQVLEKRIAGRDEVARAYEQELEKRVQADHELIEQILQNSIENILGGRLEKIRIEDHKKLEELQKAVIASNETLRLELAEKARLASNETLRLELVELRELVQALHQSHFGNATDSGD
ncbi:MAG: hypothetical protein ACYDEO_14390 [Aggregatilineales bacterium]